MGNILVQIASYRDPELPKTIQDILDKKSGEHKVIISVIDQSDELINSKYIQNYEFIPYNQTRGVCWARAKLQKTYNNEDFTLMLDSHHRFNENWDQLLIKEWESLHKNGKQPLITTYLPSYDPNNPSSRVQEPWKLNFDRFTPEGIVFTLPSVISDYQSMELPIPTQFFSAHFAFTDGEFCKKVPYDPNYYFHGEEINMAVRAFTHGYDLFTPHELIAWHEYTRVGRTKQWDDDPTWGNRNKNSLERNLQLFGIDNIKRTIDFNIYDFGNKRTLQEYEKYAGIRFRDRSVKQDTIEHKYPPCSRTSQWTNIQKHCINIPVGFLSPSHNFCAVIFKDTYDNDIYREDAEHDEIIQLISESSNSSIINLWRSFNNNTQAKRCIIWPHSKKNGWGQEMSYNLGL